MSKFSHAPGLWQYLDVFFQKTAELKIRKGSNSIIRVIGLWLLHSAIPLMALYQYIKFHLIPLSTFRDMLQTGFLLQTNYYKK